ncbi:MAG: hypothetical protein ACK50J_10390 [Planctomyces sp.]
MSDAAGHCTTGAAEPSMIRALLKSWEARVGVTGGLFCGGHIGVVDAVDCSSGVREGNRPHPARIIATKTGVIKQSGQNTHSVVFSGA